VKSPLNTGITEKVQGFDIYILARQRNPLGKYIRRVLFSFQADNYPITNKDFR
jgi:hypothetical protein